MQAGNGPSLAASFLAEHREIKKPLIGYKHQDLNANLHA